MNAPKRLLEMGGDAPAGARELLVAARRPRPMSADVRARTAAKVTAIAATPVAVGAAAKWLTGKTAAWLLGFGLLGAVCGLAVWSMSSRASGGGSGVVSESPQVSLSQPSVVKIAMPPDEPAPIASVIPTALPSVATKPSAAPKPSVAPADVLAEEQAILEAARQKMDADPAGALAEVHRHEKLAHAQLVPDREYLAIKALGKLGRKDEARARGQKFLAQWPTSPYASHVRKLIE